MEQGISKTSPRLGRINYIYWNAIIWFFLPVMLIVIFDKFFNTNIAELTSISGNITGSKVKFDLTAFWFLQVPLAIIFADGRIQDLGWPKKLSYLLWIPFLNLILFVWSGSAGENSYGVKPEKATMIRKLVVFTLPITVVITLIFSAIAVK